MNPMVTAMATTTIPPMIEATAEAPVAKAIDHCYWPGAAFLR